MSLLADAGFDQVEALGPWGGMDAQAYALAASMLGAVLGQWGSLAQDEREIALQSWQRLLAWRETQVRWLPCRTGAAHKHEADLPQQGDAEFALHRQALASLGVVVPEGLGR